MSIKKGLLFLILLSIAHFIYAQSPLDERTFQPPVHIVRPPRGIQPFAGPISGALSPSQIRSAYNLPTTGGNGTIAIIDAYDDPTIQNDFNIFSQQYGLPTATTTNFEIHKMKTTIQNATISGWDFEECLDVEWAHAIAPNAKILFVEAVSNSNNHLYAAVDYARGRSDVVAISMSWGGSESSAESTEDSHFISSYGAAFFASAGDSGTGVEYPAASPNVTGVGGTNLYFNSLGQLTAEIAWSGSGGGLSQYETEPGYQSTYGVVSANGFRAVPDVSYNSGSNSIAYVSVYDIYQGGWNGAYGTSAGAPQWAAIHALDTTAINSNFYTVAANSVAYSTTFRDITSGTNGTPGFYTTATTKYDYVTGLGSPLTTHFSLSAVPVELSKFETDSDLP